MNVGQLSSYGHGIDIFRGEIVKCDVLCADCHRKEHFVDHLEAAPDECVATADD